MSVSVSVGVTLRGGVFYLLSEANYGQSNAIGRRQREHRDQCSAIVRILLLTIIK